MNKIKVIDLLNKIANGEEIPEKIKYELKINTYLHCHYVPECLNDEVEIIEEDKKIEKFEFGEIEDREHYEIKRKINEIIDKLNEMEKE